MSSNNIFDDDFDIDKYEYQYFETIIFKANIKFSKTKHKHQKVLEWYLQDVFDDMLFDVYITPNKKDSNLTNWTIIYKNGYEIDKEKCVKMLKEYFHTVFKCDFTTPFFQHVSEDMIPLFLM